MLAVLIRLIADRAFSIHHGEARSAPIVAPMAIARRFSGKTMNAANNVAAAATAYDAFARSPHATETGISAGLVRPMRRSDTARRNAHCVWNHRHDRMRMASAVVKRNANADASGPAARFT